MSVFPICTYTPNACMFSMPLVMLYICVLLSFLTIVIASAHGESSCLLAQPRPQNAPLKDTISQALREVLATPRHGPCSDDFPTLPNGSIGNRKRRSTGSLVLEVERQNTSASISHGCIDAFNEIINKCVLGDNFWGGNIILNGINYTIYNEAYPKNWVKSVTSSFRPQRTISDNRWLHISSSLTAHSSFTHSRATDHALPQSRIHSVRQSQIKAPKPPHPSRSTSKIDSLRLLSAPSVTGTPVQSIPTTINSKGLRSGVNGSASLSSQTHSTDSSGKTIPVVPLVAGAAGLLPPVPAPPLGIGPDGIRNPSPSQHSLSQSSGSASAERRQSSSLSISSSRTMHASSSSPTASASSVKCMIFPKNGKASGNDAFASELEKAFGASLLPHENKDTGILFWSAYMTEEQRSNYSKSSVVVSRECFDE